MTAAEALRELARRWAVLHGLKPSALLGGGRRSDREARVRNQLCFVVRGLTRGRDELLGEAFDMPARGVMFARHAHQHRYVRYPMVETLTDGLVRAVARDEAFLDELCRLVAAEENRRRAEANRARADALSHASQKPGFEIGRRAGLQRYFDQGGRTALADRNRTRALPNSDSPNPDSVASA